MFTQLPKLFDRYFAIAFFLPATLLALGGALIAEIFGKPVLEAANERNIWIGATLGVAVTWILGLLLVALNRPIQRFYQGYGRFHPLCWRTGHFKARFENEAVDLFEKQNEIDAARVRGDYDDVPPAAHFTNLQRVVEELPDHADWVLPTRYGNLVRAFEVYPRVLYGLDAIPAWPRLQAVLPESMRKILDDSKSQLDFCINLSAVSCFLFFYYCTLSISSLSVPRIEIPFLAIAGGVGGYFLACNAAKQYGFHYKSAFDLYRSDLATKLGLELPRSAQHERQMWTTISRMMIYRSAARAEEATKYRLM